MIDPLLLLSQRHGEGRVTWRALHSAGFLTLGSIAGSSLEELSGRAQLSARSAGRLQQGARQLIAEGIRADLPTSLSASRSGRPARARAGRAAAGPPGPARTFSAGVTAEELALLRGERLPAEPGAPLRSADPAAPAGAHPKPAPRA